MERPDLGFSYEPVTDYYVIEAWRDLEEVVPAYTPEMVAKQTEAMADNPFVEPTPTADDDLMIGRTPGWPVGTENPDLSPQAVFGYRIGETDAENGDASVILTAGNHGPEFTGSYVLHGAVDFLTSDAVEAVALRRNAVIYVYPDVNPEARYQTVHRLDLEGAPDPNAGTDFRYRGNPELYAAGETDMNRVWHRGDEFHTVDVVTGAMRADTGANVDYIFDMHGPQEVANWRSPQGHDAWESHYGTALQRREPEVRIAGVPDGDFKTGLFDDTPPGKLPVWACTPEGLDIEYAFIHEPGCWTAERCMLSGRRIMLALYDAVVGDAQ